MLLELGNHDVAHPNTDGRPSVTRIEIPEFDKHGLGGYTHKPGAITAKDFQRELFEAEEMRGGIYRLPDQEALLAVRNAWRAESHGRPAWLQITPHPELTGKGVAKHLEQVLHDHFGTGGARKPPNFEDTYWTRYGQPGEGPPLGPPDIRNVYTADGRIMNNFNDGGDSFTALGSVIGVGTGSTATTLTGCTGLTASGLIGHRVYVYSTTSNNFVWGNVSANTATVITVDQWYNVSTPGGAVGTSPTTPWAFVVVDGGMVSTWFAGIGTGANSLTNTDHTLATSGNVEYTQAGGTLIRKICPTAVTVSSSARTVTLVPVFTANASDVANLPKVFSVIGFFASMVVGYGGAGGPMKFETAISPTATIAALNDQVTVTETITGS